MKAYKMCVSFLLFLATCALRYLFYITYQLEKKGSSYAKWSADEGQVALFLVILCIGVVIVMSLLLMIRRKKQVGSLLLIHQILTFLLLLTVSFVAIKMWNIFNLGNDALLKYNYLRSKDNLILVTNVMIFISITLIGICIMINFDKMREIKVKQNILYTQLSIFALMMVVVWFGAKSNVANKIVLDVKNDVIVSSDEGYYEDTNSVAYLSFTKEYNQMLSDIGVSGYHLILADREEVYGSETPLLMVKFDKNTPEHLRKGETFTYRIYGTKQAKNVFEILHEDEDISYTFKNTKERVYEVSEIQAYMDDWKNKIQKELESDDKDIQSITLKGIKLAYSKNEHDEEYDGEVYIFYLVEYLDKENPQNETLYVLKYTSLQTRADDLEDKDSSLYERTLTSKEEVDNKINEILFRDHEFIIDIE